MAVVFLDTNLVLWGILQQAKPGQKGMIARAQYLLEDLENKRHDVQIASLTLAEVLCGTPKKSHGRVRDALSRHLMVIPYDTKAAKEAATIWKTHREDGTYDFLKDEIGIVRQQFKTDCMILGTAISRNADMLYTHDAGLVKLARNYIKVPELPMVPPKMIQLPFDEEEQPGESEAG